MMVAGETSGAVTLNAFREQMASYRRAFDQEAAKLKDSQLVLVRLKNLFLKLDATERKAVEQVLAEWVLSDDENVRFDALALIDYFKIKGATHALEKLAVRLAASGAVSAPFELSKIKRVIAHIGGTSRVGQ